MKICGFQKTTLLDFPGHVAATVFTGGCNFRCPYCHNSELVLRPDLREQISELEIFEFLKKRRGILEGVCITGGEPTLQKDLEEFIEQVRELGYLVKLDTNGYRPEILSRLLERGLLDYVAMDIKASRENYGNAAGLREMDVDRISESVSILLGQNAKGTDYEFRTTVVKGIHTAEEFERIGQWLEGAVAYFLQSYRESEKVLVPGRYESFSAEELDEMARIARKHIARVEVRGVQ